MPTFSGIVLTALTLFTRKDTLISHYVIHEGKKRNLHLRITRKPNSKTKNKPLSKPKSGVLRNSSTILNPKTTIFL